MFCSRSTPTLLLAAAIFSFATSARAEINENLSIVEPDLRMICSPTGNEDLARLEIREILSVSPEELRGSQPARKARLYFREIDARGGVYSNFRIFSWDNVSQNTMPLISKHRMVQRIAQTGVSPVWMIGGKKADCAKPNSFQKIPTHTTDALPAGLTVSCDQLPFDDLKKIEIYERITEDDYLPGRYKMIETFASGLKNRIRESFGGNALIPEDRKNLGLIPEALPELSGVGGYRRYLRRVSTGHWVVLTADYCSASETPIHCEVY